jgi:hypothetical protein
MFLNIFCVTLLWGTSTPRQMAAGGHSGGSKMTTLPFKLSVDPAPAQFMLTVRGSLAAPTREAGRLAHNQVAGSDEAVAMARSFGDLSHAVYVPTDAPPAGAGELLIIDYWNSVEGLMTFFANEQVQMGGKLVFKADRQNVMWQSTPGLPNFNLPAPMGKNERYVGWRRARSNHARRRRRCCRR